jgi:MscS family membrane protein
MTTRFNKPVRYHLRKTACSTTLLIALAACFALILNISHAAEQPTIKDVMQGSGVDKTKPVEKSALTKTDVSQPPPGPKDEFNRGVPRTSVEGFLTATRKGDNERASEYLDLRNLPRGLSKSDGPELARQLKVVLDSKLWIDLSDISADPNGHKNDGLPRYRDSLGTIEFDKQKFDILLQRVPRGDGVRIWKFSSKTVAQIPELYDEFGYGPIGEKLSSLFPSDEFIGLQLWQWIFLSGLIVLAYTTAFIPTWLFAVYLRRRKTHFSDQFARFVTGPTRLLIMVMLVRSWFELISPSLTARAIVEGQTLLIIIIIWMIFRIIDLMRDYYQTRISTHETSATKVLLRPMSNFIKTLVVIIASLVWLDNLGFQVTTLIAGLGIGGLAIALAAQKSMENLIGAVTLYTSAPVKVGDFCRFGDKSGVVEEIGLRSTVIRTLERTAIHVPNAAFSELHLENFADRDKMLYRPKINLRIDTSPDQVRYVLVEIRKLFYAHPKVDSEPARMRFTGIGEDSLELEGFVYILTKDLGEYLEISEDLNLRIMDVVQSAGTTLAIPARTVFTDEGYRPDRAKAQVAEAKVKEWRESNQLNLPNFSQSTIDELRDSLDYPPKGSSAT